MSSWSPLLTRSLQRCSWCVCWRVSQRAAAAGVACMLLHTRDQQCEGIKQVSCYKCLPVSCSFCCVRLECAAAAWEYMPAYNDTGYKTGADDMVPSMQATQDMHDTLQLAVLTGKLYLCPAVCVVKEVVAAACKIKLARHQGRHQTRALHRICISGSSTGPVHCAAVSKGWPADQHVPCSLCCGEMCCSSMLRAPCMPWWEGGTKSTVTRSSRVQGCRSGSRKAER